MTVTDVYYDPWDYSIDADPYPVWRRLRDEAPVYFNEQHDFYALSRYDDDGNPLASTFMDYLLPTVHEIPVIDTFHIESPAATVGGYKGVGEGGAIAAPAAVFNAIADALAQHGVIVTDQPLDPDAVVRAITEGAAV